MEKTCDIKTSIIAMQTVISMILIAWGQNMILFVAFRVKATFAPECRGVVVSHYQQYYGIYNFMQIARGATTMVVYTTLFKSLCVFLFCLIANSIYF